MLGNLTVVATSDGKHTTVILRTGETLTANGDGTYTYTSKTGNTVTTYTIVIDPGLIRSGDELTVDVTLSVGDGTYTDGIFKDSGYTVDDTGIATLLKDVLQVVDDGKGNTTVGIKDNVTHSSKKNSDGSTTYTVTKNGTEYTFTKNTDGTFTYDTGVVLYTVTVVPGNISSYVNTAVTITVGDGTITDGVFKGSGYTISDPALAELLGELTVVQTSDGHTTVTLPNGKVTDNGDGTYTLTATIDGVTTTYTITIDPGDITNYVNTAVTISVGDGTITDGVFEDNGYTVDNEIIRALLTGELKVTYNKATGTTSVGFADTSNLTKSGTNYKVYWPITFRRQRFND